MPTTTELLSAPLAQASYWSLGENDAFTAFVRRPTDDDTDLYVVPSAYLSRYHENFPLALKAYLNWRLSNSGATFAVREEAQYVLAVAKLGGPTFIDLGTTPCYLHSILQITSHLNDAEPKMEFMANVVTVETSEIDGIAVAHPGYQTVRRVFVSVEELNSRYPDWEKRYQIAQELGVTETELRNYLFYPEKTPEVTMADVIFDDSPQA